MEAKRVPCFTAALIGVTAVLSDRGSSTCTGSYYLTAQDYEVLKKIEFN